MLPLVSVIMPAYNGEKYIGDAIESILGQTYARYELIIVEDCSTDKTLEIIKRYTDAGIVLVQNESNRGISYSTNYGIRLSHGKYIALMDDDDISLKNRLEIQVDYLEKNEDIDVLGGRYNQIDAKGNILRWGRTPKFNPKYNKAMLLFNTCFANGTSMIRKQFIETNNLWYQENCYGMQDFKFFIDCSKVGKISSVGNLLLCHRVHECNETTRRLQKYGEQRKQKYAELQRDSLKRSGFMLDKEKMMIINKTLAEYDGKCKDKNELQMLYEAFYEIMRQARAMQIDYYAELEHYCKLILSEQVRKLIYF